MGESELLAALRTPTRDGVYSLAIPLSNDLPASPMHDPLIYYQWFTQEQGRRELLQRGFEDATIGIMTDRVEMPLHAGTHMDAPAHFCRNGRLFRGVPVDEITPHGASAGLGIDAAAPVITPGVLLDVPGARGVDVLESGYQVTAEDLEAARIWAGLPAIPSGTAVLVRTGWLAVNGKSRRRYYAGEPGLARDKVYQFLLVVAPLPFRGATGSPVAPVAIA